MLSLVARTKPISFTADELLLVQVTIAIQIHGLELVDETPAKVKA